MTETGKLLVKGHEVELPIVVGTEDEHAINISKLRSDSGFITLDDGYGNTGACQSSVCFINGEKGILRYRGIPIDQLAEKSTFIEVCMLLPLTQLPFCAFIFPSIHALTNIPQ